MEYVVQDVDCDLVDAGKNDRVKFDDAELRNLASSIGEYGLAQPITVRQVGERYEIVAGERRFRAVSQVLGWSTCPAIVRPLGDEEASVVMLFENTSRVDLNPVEEAVGFQRRLESMDLEVEDLARMVGVTPNRIRKRMMLLSLVPEALEMVRNGSLGVRWGIELSRLSPEYQRAALPKLASDMTWYDWHELCQRLLFRQQEETLFDLELVNEEWEGVQKKSRKGRLREAVRLLTEITTIGAQHRLPEELEQLVCQAAEFLESEA